MLAERGVSTNLLVTLVTNNLVLANNSHQWLLLTNSLNALALSCYKLSTSNNYECNVTLDDRLHTTYMRELVHRVTRQA